MGRYIVIGSLPRRKFGNALRAATAKRLLWVKSRPEQRLARRPFSARSGHSGTRFPTILWRAF